MDCTCGLLVRIWNFFFRDHADRGHSYDVIIGCDNSYDFNVTSSGKPVASPEGDVIDDG